jgi:hypothetical protein
VRKYGRDVAKLYVSPNSTGGTWGQGIAAEAVHEDVNKSKVNWEVSSEAHNPMHITALRAFGVVAHNRSNMAP